MNEKIRNIQLEIEEVISCTTTLCFPFFSSEAQKRELIDEHKKNIETSISEILEKYGVSLHFDDDEITKIWCDAYNISISEFEDLHDKQKINSFFLQEVMHEYLSSLFKHILVSIDD